MHMHMHMHMYMYMSMYMLHSLRPQEAARASRR